MVRSMSPNEGEGTCDSPSETGSNFTSSQPCSSSFPGDSTQTMLSSRTWTSYVHRRMPVSLSPATKDLIQLNPHLL